MSHSTLHHAPSYLSRHFPCKAHHLVYNIFQNIFKILIVFRWNLYLSKFLVSSSEPRKILHNPLQTLHLSVCISVHFPWKQCRLTLSTFLHAKNIVSSLHLSYIRRFLWCQWSTIPSCSGHYKTSPQLARRSIAAHQQSDMHLYNITTEFLGLWQQSSRRTTCTTPHFIVITWQLLAPYSKLYVPQLLQYLLGLALPSFHS